MTFSAANNRATYTGNGVTVAFSFPYLFKDNDHLKVYIDGDLYGSGYTITGAGNPSGGTVTFSTAPANGVSVVLLRQVPYVQETDIVDFDGNPAQVTEDQFDLCVMMASQLNEIGARTITVPVDVTLASSEISGTIDSTTRLMALSTSGPSIVDIADISTSLDTVITTPVSGEVLTWDGTNWVNEPSTIPDGSITTAKIGDDQVTAAKIADGAIDNAAKVSDFVLGYYKMDTAAIASTANIISGTVAKLAPAASLAPLYYGCKTYQTTGTSVATGTWTSILFDTEAWDDSTWHSTSSNTERHTFDFSGRVSVVASYASNATDNASYGVRILKNGTVVARAFEASGASSAEVTQIPLSVELDVVATDYIEMQAYQNSGSSKTTQTGLSGTSLSSKRIR